MSKSRNRVMRIRISLHDSRASTPVRYARVKWRLVLTFSCAQREGRRGCVPCASGLGRAVRVRRRLKTQIMYKCCWGNTLPNTHPLAPLKKVPSHPFSVAATAGSGSGSVFGSGSAARWPSCCTTGAADAAAPLRRSTPSSSTTPPRASRCSCCHTQPLDQVRHRHRAPTSALRTPARRHPSDRHSPRACRAAAGASARAAAAALYTFSLNDEPRGAAERPLAAGAAGAPARRQPRARVSTRRRRRTQRK